MVIKCPVCGEENPDDATICKACGAPLGNSSEKKAKSGKVLIAIFIFAILVVVAIVAAPIVYKSVPSHNKTDDSDGDGMPDEWELANGLNPNDPGDRNSDADSDGLTNYEEYQLGTDPQNPDTDGDGIPDGLDLIPKADAGIRVTITKIRIWDYVDGIWPLYKDTGQIFARIYVDDNLVGEAPSEPAELEIDKIYDVNWSITTNVSDDRSHKVRIEIYDKDLIGEEMLDINGDSPSKDKAGYYLEINYYLGTGDVGRTQTSDPNNPPDGSNDGNSGLQDDKDAMIEYTITTIDMSTV